MVALAKTDPTKLSPNTNTPKDQNMTPIYGPKTLAKTNKVPHIWPPIDDKTPKMN